VKCPKIHERKHELYCQNPLCDNQDQEKKRKNGEDDVKEIKPCTKRTKRNSPKKKGQMQVQSPIKLMREGPT